VCFCNRACLKAAWPEHRLSCPKAGTGKSGFSNGDIVKIQGLTSENGLKINGLLAEVVHVEKDSERVIVLASPESFTIRGLAIKPENLEMYLSVSDAATKAASLQIEIPPDDIDLQQDEFMKENIIIYKSLPSLSGREIVQRIKESDRFFIQALQLTRHNDNLSIKQKEDMLKNGIIDACLRVFKFPETIDRERDQDEPYMPSLLGILGHLLAGSRGLSTAYLHPYRLETCRKLAPAILLCSTKKRRLFGMTEHWWSAQPGFNFLVGNCFRAGEEALTSLIPVVTTALLEYTVFQLTVDPKLYLRKRTAIRTNMLALGSSKISAFPILHELLSFGDVTTRRIGLMQVPAGATLAGRAFASCFLQVAATVVVEAQTSGELREIGQPLTDELKWIYSMLLKVPGFEELLGDYDAEFGNLCTPLQLFQWAKKKLAPTA
jgi:hypothetical protein